MRSYESFEPIYDLEWAKRTEAPDWLKDAPKPNAAQRKGLAFEERCFLGLKDTLPVEYEILHGQWIEYKDKSGPIPKLCQPDFVIPPYGLPYGIILECKLTYRPAAFAKLQQLYRPLVSHIWSGEFKVIQMCKKLGKYKGPIYYLNQLLEAPDGSVIHHRL